MAQELVVLLREATGRQHPIYVYGGASVEAWARDQYGDVLARYAYGTPVPTSHGVSVLVADRLYGPERASSYYDADTFRHWLFRLLGVAR